MTTSELLSRFRNLLITLSRQQSDMAIRAQQIRIEAQQEVSTGRRAGLYIHANQLAKNANILAATIKRHGKVLRHFFETTNLDEICRAERLDACSESDYKPTHGTAPYPEARKATAVPIVQRR